MAGSPQIAATIWQNWQIDCHRWQDRQFEKHREVRYLPRKLEVISQNRGREQRTAPVDSSHIQHRGTRATAQPQRQPEQEQLGFWKLDGFGLGDWNLDNLCGNRKNVDFPKS
jgi:hypothetical protein